MSQIVGQNFEIEAVVAAATEKYEKVTKYESSSQILTLLNNYSLVVE